MGMGEMILPVICFWNLIMRVQRSHRALKSLLIGPLPTSTVPSPTEVATSSCEGTSLDSDERSFEGGDGNDCVESIGSHKSIDLGEGDNHLYSVGSRNVARSGSGNDYFDMRGGDQAVFSDGGNNTVLTDDGNDFVALGDGADLIRTRGGNDRVFSGGGDDRVYVGSGKDIVFAGDGDDKVYGDSGYNVFHGEAGNDLLIGGSDTDYLSGGADNDVLQGNQGFNTYQGGTGADHFILGSGSDWVNDFSSSEGDTVSFGEKFLDLGVTIENNFYVCFKGLTADGEATDGTIVCQDAGQAKTLALELASSW